MTEERNFVPISPEGLNAIQVGTTPFKPGQSEGGLTPQVAASTPGEIPKAAPGGKRINRLTGKPFGYDPGLSGAELAKHNMATMGVPGAIADYQKRSAADAAKITAAKDKKTTDKWRGATAPSPTANPLAPLPAVQKGFRATAGLPAPSFAMAPVVNPQAVATPRPVPTPAPVSKPPAQSPAPASTFQALTTPPAVTGPPAPAKPQPFYRQPPTPPAGGPAFTTPAAQSAQREDEIAKQRGASRQNYNAAWNKQPNLPIADPNSMANKGYKSLRTFFSGHSY